MHRSLHSFNIALLLAFAAGLAPAQAPTAQPARVEYKAGQLWRYATGDGPTITVLNVEDSPRIGRVIHVRVDNIPVQGCAGIHLTKSIDHIALSEKMMRKSVNDLLREDTTYRIRTSKAIANGRSKRNRKS